MPAIVSLDAKVCNFGRPKTAGDWIVHIAGAIVAIYLVWWMLARGNSNKAQEPLIDGDASISVNFDPCF